MLLTGSDLYNKHELFTIRIVNNRESRYSDVYANSKMASSSSFLAQSIDFDEDSDDDHDYDPTQNVEGKFSCHFSMLLLTFWPIEQDSDDEDPEDDDSDGNDDHDDCSIESSALSWGYTSNKRKRSRYDIWKGEEGPTATSLNMISPQEFFGLFFSKGMMDIIIKNTNKNEAGKEGWIDINLEELNAFIGILIMNGVTCQRTSPLRVIWKKNHLSIPFFRSVMRMKRMEQLLSCIRFDDFQMRSTENIDRLAKIRELNDLFKGNCLNHFIPGPFVTIDKRTSVFRGRCKFKTYNPNKPDPYGIKIWMLLDNATKYVSNFQVYTGKIGPTPEKNQAERVVKELSFHLKSGCQITADNFFTSLALVAHLLQNQITYIGTMRSNRKGIPEYIKEKNREEFTTRFMFSGDLQFTSYSPKKNKTVIILSSGNHEESMMNDPHSKQKMKPQIIDEYNKTKAGVDTFDQMVKDYSVRRSTRRWTMNLFYNMIDMAAMNSYILFKIRTKSEISRREFLIRLSELLVKGHASTRLNTSRFISPIKSKELKVLTGSSSSSISNRVNIQTI